MENQKKKIESRYIHENAVAELFARNYLFHPGMIEVDTSSEIKRAVNDLYRNKLIMQGII